MIAPACRHTHVKRHGHDRNGNQRFRCLLCGLTWIKEQSKPLGNMRIAKDKAVLCLRLLLEGNSIRSVERITHTHRDTILDLLETIGRRAMLYWQTKMHNLPATDVECDEIWGFIGCKEKTRQRMQYGDGCGDCYTFTAIERTTKLLLAFHVGKRTPGDTVAFAERLRSSAMGRCQVSTDGYRPYEYAIPDAFQGQVDFAQIIKVYGGQPDGPGTRYSPAAILDVRMHSVCGYPDPSMVCTSHIERHNLSIRMAVRRMTRLTNAFSKKWQNHEYHLALYFLYYNFCRVHMTIKTTPAVAAGIVKEKWTIENLLDELARD
jgi:transposase-like protein/IS1 family transposase